MNRAQFEALPTKPLRSTNRWTASLPTRLGSQYKRSPVYRIPTKWPLTRIDSVNGHVVLFVHNKLVIRIHKVMYDDDDASLKTRRNLPRKT